MERPEITSLEWRAYVMNQFDPSELVDGNPTVAGLWRICEKLIGEIVETESIVKQCPDRNNDHRATVEASITIRKPVDKYPTVIYSDCADCFQHNVDLEFAKYPVAVASTRALGRCLRRALRLGNTIAAEETSKNTMSIVDFRQMEDTQKVWLETLAKKCKINLPKFLTYGENNFASLDELSYEQAQKFGEVLNKYAQKKDSIPEEIKQ